MLLHAVQYIKSRELSGSLDFVFVTLRLIHEAFNDEVANGANVAVLVYIAYQFDLGFRYDCVDNRRELLGPQSSYKE